MAVSVVSVLLLAGLGAPPGLARGWLASTPATAANGHATYFAGRSYPEGGGGSATTEFFVPELTCTSTNTGAAAGAFMYTATGSEHHGSGQTDLSAASVQLFCLRGEPAPLPAVELRGKQTYGPVRPHMGDLMRATVVDSPSTLTATLQDLTENHTFTLSRSTFAAPSTAAAIGDQALTGVPSLTPGPVYPVTDFGTIHFGAGRVNGTLLGAAGGKRLDMVGGHRVLQIKTGRLTGRGPLRSRGAFATFFRHA